MLAGMDRKQLADFLRTRRARITPRDVGLPNNHRRRLPGLRREEVAQLAGICLYLGIVSCMTTTKTTVVAREYLRVSVDRSKKERSPQEQHADNARAAAARNWKLGKEYRDIGSASRYATKARKEFDLLMSDLEKGRFDANILILWESSRGSRKLSEWVRLIELCEERQVRIYVTSDGKLYDPSDPRDRRSLQEDGVDSEYESAKISKRTKRSNGSNAALGRPNGAVPFGYTRRYDPSTGRLVAQEPHPGEAPVVRELFTRLHQGHALNAIAKDFEARGIRTRSGKVFSAPHLRSLAVTRAYAGEREHCPGRQGSRGRGSAETRYYKGMWKPLVSRETFLSVQRLLSDPARKKTKPGKGVHLLSFIARCDVCSGPLAYRNGRTIPELSCHPSGHVRVSYEELTLLAEELILGFLSRKDVWRQLAHDGGDEQLQQVRDEVASIRAELDELADQVAAGNLTATLAARAEPGILKRLREAEAREAELSTPATLQGLIDPGKDVARRWKKVPMSAKRQVARLLLVPEVLGELRIAPSPVKGVRAPVVDRIVWRR